MKNNKKRSFITNCIVLNIISLILMATLFVLISTIVNWKLEKSFPMLEDLLQYEERLKQDDYAKLPLKEFQNCSMIIYDSDNNMLYSSNKMIGEDIDVNDIDYINEYYNLEYYIVYNFIKKGEYYVMKVKINEETEEEVVEGVAILNTDLEVVEGNLFEKGIKISEFQFEMMNGKYNDYQIEKYQYENSNGEDRVLLFISPEFTNENYNKVLEEASRLWLLAIPFIMILILAEIVIYKKKLQKYIEPLNSIINSYRDKKENIIDNSQISIEFQTIVDNFKLLLEKMDTNEIEKNKMIANISHDLKTPLTAIKGYAQAFKDNIVPEDKKEQYLTAIYDKTVIATDLINRLFEYTKLEHPEYKMKLTEIDINEFSRAYFAQKYPEIEIMGFILEVKIPEEECKCFIDKELFIRLYDNLISNILKYNQKGTKITFGITEQKDKVRIVIADNGVGIPEHVRKNLFEPFVTGNQARTSGEGTGLGMTIVKKIVELHNGKISLSSDKKYKTKFNMEFKKSK